MFTPLKLLTAAVTVLTGLILVVYYLTEVNEYDVYAYHTFDSPVRERPLRAGDIVALEPDGDMPRVCDLNLDEAAFDADPLSDVYLNSLRESIPQAAAYIAWAGEQVGLGRGDAAPFMVRLERPFVGRKTVLAQVEEAPDLSDSCECRQVRRLAQGDPVCTVNASLIETTRPQWPGETRLPDSAVGRTVAVDLAGRSNWMSDAAFARCGVELDAVARKARRAQCHGRLPFDAKMRRMLGLIEREGRPITAPY